MVTVLIKRNVIRVMQGCCSCFLRCRVSFFLEILLNLHTVIFTHCCHPDFSLGQYLLLATEHVVKMFV